MTSHTDIFERLKLDHDKHRDLLDRITATDGASSERKALFEEFTFEAKGHAAAEEQALYSTVLRKPPLTSCGRHSVAEHHEIEEMLNDVAAADMASDEWEEKFGELKHRYLHHIDEEEDEMFPKFAEELSEDDAVYMRGVFDRRKREEKAQAEVTPEKKDDKDD